MMTLVKEIGDLVIKSNPQCPFFASDVIGVRHWNYKAPYALVAHATYQDSNCRPEAWSYGLYQTSSSVVVARSNPDSPAPPADFHAAFPP